MFEIGVVHNIAKSNTFMVKNLKDFQKGLEPYVGGDFGDNPLEFTYSGGTKKGNHIEIDIAAYDFSDMLFVQDESLTDDDGQLLPETLNVYEYIQEHLESGIVLIHLVSYEHPADMTITHIQITKDSIQKISILE